MSQLLIYFIDENVDPQIQAEDLEKQISENLFNMDETEGQRGRNIKVADALSEKFPDLHQYEDVFADVEKEPESAESEEGYASIALSDQNGIRLEIVGSYVFIVAPDVGHMWEYQLMEKIIIRIVRFLQLHFDTLVFDLDTAETLDFSTEEFENV